MNLDPLPRDENAETTRLATGVGLAITLAMYVISFLAPVDHGDFGKDEIGANLFIIGLLYCWFPICYAWWANVLFWIALAFTFAGRGRKHLPLSFGAAMLAGSYLFLNEDMIRSPAFLLWWGSMIVLALTTLAPPVEDRSLRVSLDEDAPDR